MARWQIDRCGRPQRDTGADTQFQTVGQEALSGLTRQYGRSSAGPIGKVIGDVRDADAPFTRSPPVDEICFGGVAVARISCALIEPASRDDARSVTKGIATIGSELATAELDAVDLAGSEIGIGFAGVCE